jgi:hypothetical protein
VYVGLVVDRVAVGQVLVTDSVLPPVSTTPLLLQCHSTTTPPTTGATQSQLTSKEILVPPLSCLSEV